ncbi:hypothetical protein BCR44DRAFT_1127276 [Catenaria anguillulae PL171]|uniref:Uncharacterized protein n=1 Tax=Catenaria anguillulae PL171 TaxID=765915 RepID=A0A1Y2HNH2_9FUNG|nr:hypothetical protein BCR44DRAFT_1127276 [Catenaria anguillulae PL171]
MCDSPSASQHHDGMLESGTAETASVHTVGPDADYRHGFDGDKSKENAKQKRYSAEPPPYDAHDFEKQKHTSSTRLGVLKEKLPSEKRSLSEPASPTEMELEKLVITIERLNRRGRLDDQAVHLTTRQRDQLEDAAITARIGRLARGRFEDQRAVSSANEQTQLMAAITDSNKTSSLTNQRVEISSQMQRRMELARLGHLADRLANSGRMEDQDAVPKRVRELDHLARELERLSRPSGMDSQRYTMNDAKEKDMFLSQMAHRVSRLTDCRMEDQAADGPGVRKAAAFTEVDQALDRMAALSSHLMDGQRYHV